jgi:hypothetical protein
LIGSKPRMPCATPRAGSAACGRSVGTSLGPALPPTRGVGPSCGRRAHRTRCMPSILTASDTLMTRVRSGRRRVDHDVAKSRALGSVRAARPASPQGSHSSTTAARLNRPSSGAPIRRGTPDRDRRRPAGRGSRVGASATAPPESLEIGSVIDPVLVEGVIGGGPEPTRVPSARGCRLRWALVENVT